MDASQGEVNILCFGDSLTEGLVKYNIMHPYSSTLESIFAHQNIHNIQIRNYGISGASAVRDMPATLRRIPASPPFDYAIILGGTNDISSRDPDSIFHALEEIHHFALTQLRVKRTFAVTIPETGFEHIPKMHDSRILVNQRLRDMVAQCPDKISLIDLEHQVPNSQTELWVGDGLHMSVQGYNRFGEIVFDSLLPFLTARGFHLNQTGS
jgi:lysophospholipase L1-like esterase